MHPREAILDWNDRFRTEEEDGIRASDASRAYWRLHDPFCHQLLTARFGQGIQRAGAEFMGTFFPFYRKASLFALPHDEEFLPHWLLLAFSAGQCYGEHHPTEADALFESERSQMQAAWDMLTALRIGLDGRRISPAIFGAALTACCRRNPLHGESSVNDEIIASSQNVIWVGLLAATDARNDILQLELLERVDRIARTSALPLHFRALISAARDAHNRPTFELLLHPLLDVATEKYIATPLEGSVILKYLNQQLRRFGRKREEDCPVQNRDLRSWIAEAITFALQFADTDQDLLSRVFIETGHSRLRDVLKILHKVLAGIENGKPAHITNAILRWHKRTYGWSTPRYYGEALERVVQCVDLAIWLAWAPQLGEFPDVSSKRGMSM
jgi:hypothetical protein